MGLLDWMTGSVGRDLDRRVGGTEGTAHAHFSTLVDDADVSVRAVIANGHAGTVELHVGERRGEGRGSASANLGPGKELRGRELVAEAAIHRAGPSELAILTVEVLQRDPGGGDRAPLAFETFSVESRFDTTGKARLTLAIKLG